MHLHQRRQDGMGWMVLMFPNTTHMAGIRRVPFPSNPIIIWCLHKKIEVSPCPSPLIMPSSTHSQNQWNCCHYLRRLYIPYSSNQVPQCKYEWIIVKGMSNLNVYCLTTYAGEHCSIALDLTPLFYYESAKHVYSTECEWWSLSNSTVGEVCHCLFSQSSTQPTALHTMEDHLLDYCIPTYHLVTTAS